MILKGVSLSKTYKRHGENFNAVDNADFIAGHGDFTVIFGESGSGKSTLLSALAGIGKPTSGVVEIDGESLFDLDDGKLSLFRNEHIGYVPQNVSALSSFSVYENVKLAADLYGNDIAEDYVLSLLVKLGIAHLADERPENLSGGELRRVAIARALVNRPGLLIADEPTSNLDEENSRKIFDLFAELAKEGTVVVIATHDRSALRYGERVYHMLHGILSLQSKSDHDQK